MLLMAGICSRAGLHAQPADTGASPAPADALASFQLERSNAWLQVCAIVNQPVQAYTRTPDMSVSEYSPGWFHPGASTPAFDSVDVRQSQQLIYANEPYVTSDVNPGIVFLGRDLEFNAMTKLFYTNRSLPKHRLSEAEMLEINRLYRVIGHCNNQIARLQVGSAAEAGDDGSEAPPAGGLRDRLSRIPREKRVFYGGIGIGALLVLAIALRARRSKSDAG